MDSPSYSLLLQFPPVEGSGEMTSTSLPKINTNSLLGLTMRKSHLSTEVAFVHINKVVVLLLMGLQVDEPDSTDFTFFLELC